MIMTHDKGTSNKGLPRPFPRASKTFEALPRALRPPPPPPGTFRGLARPCNGFQDRQDIPETSTDLHRPPETLQWLPRELQEFQGRRTAPKRDTIQAASERVPSVFQGLPRPCKGIRGGPPASRDLAGAPSGAPGLANRDVQKRPRDIPRVSKRPPSACQGLAGGSRHLSGSSDPVFQGLSRNPPTRCKALQGRARNSNPPPRAVCSLPFPEFSNRVWPPCTSDRVSEGPYFMQSRVSTAILRATPKNPTDVSPASREDELSAFASKPGSASSASSSSGLLSTASEKGDKRLDSSGGLS